MTLAESSNSLFDQIGGLPLHPLAVHAATVLIPLGALALAVILFVPKWRKTFLPVTVGILGVASLAAYVAKESGEALASRIGISEIHEQLGTALVPATFILFLLGAVAWWLDRKGAPKWQIGAAAVVSIVAVGVAVSLTFLTGHSGAQATWGDVISQSTQQPISSDDEGDDDSSSQPSESPTAVDGAITLEEVAKHSTPSDCWSAIDGNVYDLTSFISRHPGGAQPLEQLCGIDGTEAFMNQHGGQGEPASELRQLLVGPLAG